MIQHVPDLRPSCSEIIQELRLLKDPESVSKYLQSSALHLLDPDSSWRPGCTTDVMKTSALFSLIKKPRIFLGRSPPSQYGRGILGRWTKRQFSDQFPIVYGRSLEIPSLNWEVSRTPRDSLVLLRKFDA